MQDGLTQVKYCLYARKSSESDERQTMSIDSQIKEMMAMAEREGLLVVDTKHESFSAKQSSCRPIFNDLLTDIYDQFERRVSNKKGHLYGYSGEGNELELPSEITEQLPKVSDNSRKLNHYLSVKAAARYVSPNSYSDEPVFFYEDASGRPATAIIKLEQDEFVEQPGRYRTTAILEYAIFADENGELQIEKNLTVREQSDKMEFGVTGQVFQTPEERIPSQEEIDAILGFLQTSPVKPASF